MKNKLLERFSLRMVLNALFLTLIFSLGFMQPSVIVGGMSVIATDAIFLLTGGVWLIAPRPVIPEPQFMELRPPLPPPPPPPPPR